MVCNGRLPLPSYLSNEITRFNGFRSWGNGIILPFDLKQFKERLGYMV
jgi:hypothetical protein